jgi:hypothetical protein
LVSVFTCACARERYLPFPQSLFNYFEIICSGDGLQSAEKVLICLESARNIESAQEICDEHVHKDLISSIKTKVVAERILELEHGFVLKLLKQGIISQADSEPMFATIEKDADVVHKACKHNAKTMAAIQTLIAQAESHGFGKPWFYLFLNSFVWDSVGLCLPTLSYSVFFCDIRSVGSFWSSAG